MKYQGGFAGSGPVFSLLFNGSDPEETTEIGSLAIPRMSWTVGNHEEDRRYKRDQEIRK
jgi:hypothetical protein